MKETSDFGWGDGMKGLFPEKYPELYIAHLYCFNIGRDYYECHEVLEELWLETGRHPLYQGLLQVAVGLHHFRNGNVNGARKLFRKALAKLHAFPDECQGIDLGKLKQDVSVYLAKLEEYEAAPFPFYDMTITITDPALRGHVERFNGEQT